MFTFCLRLGMLRSGESSPERTARRLLFYVRSILMPQVELNRPAPDFTLTDSQGREISLSQFKNHQPVLLVFNRGFM